MTTTATAAKTAKTLVRCACAEFEVGITTEENGEPIFDGETTGCDSATRRVFAPGHDARLKSLLIKAGIAGMEVHYGGGIVSDAVKAARQFGFADLVAAGIERGIAKAKAKAEKGAGAPRGPRKPKNKEAAAERAAALTAKMAEVQAKVTPVAEVPQPDVAATVAAKLASEDAAWAEAAPVAATTRIKVGRWEFAATIAPNGDATYTSAKGETKVVLDGNYKLV